MISAQDIREKTFEKTVFGGYEMAGVDAFLDEVANDMAAVQKENSVLKGKMKVLVAKIEEYRSSEDALRMAILSAQKMGNMIEKEAREKSEKLVNDAMADAAQVTKEAELEVEMEKARLEQARKGSAQFVENMELLCRKQMDFIARLKQSDFMKQSMPAAQESAAPAANEVHETVKSIEETVAKAVRESAGAVKPSISQMRPAPVEEPTRAFDVVSAGIDGDGDFDKTTQFLFDPQGK